MIRSNKLAHMKILKTDYMVFLFFFFFGKTQVLIEYTVSPLVKYICA